LKGQLDQERAEKARIFSSSSWRFSAPLRALSRMSRALIRFTRSTFWQIAVIRMSPLFDAKWYRRRYPDVAAAGVDPASHYFHFGAAEGRAPGPRFSTAYYVKSYPDVAAARINPLVHYVLHGAAERREVHPATETPKRSASSLKTGRE
jgi:hypothetical protein